MPDPQDDLQTFATEDELVGIAREAYVGNGRTQGCQNLEVSTLYYEKPGEEPEESLCTESNLSVLCILHVYGTGLMRGRCIYAGLRGELWNLYRATV